MPDPPPAPIRPSAKAAVLDGSRLLVTRNRSHRDPGGDWLLLPGGGPRVGETLVAAVRREVAEETGLAVEVGGLLWIREYLADHHELAGFEAGKHHIEFMFECRAAGRIGAPSAADDHQVGWEWVEVDDPGSRRFYPAALAAPLRRFAAGGDPGPVYLGDVN